MQPQNLELNDLRDIEGVRRAKRGKNDQKAFNLVYSHEKDVLHLKPVISQPKPAPIRHIDLALRATIITPRLQRERAVHLVHNFPMKNVFYKLWYRIYDDSGNLRSMYEQAPDSFKFNIVLDLGFIEGKQEEWSSVQVFKIPINFEANYENIIEGKVFEVDVPTKAVNVSVVLDHSGNSIIFPGFRIRVYLEPINNNSLHAYDLTHSVRQPNFEIVQITRT